MTTATAAAYAVAMEVNRVAMEQASVIALKEFPVGAQVQLYGRTGTVLRHTQGLNVEVRLSPSLTTWTHSYYLKPVQA